MPEEEDEDQISKNEAASCCGGRRSYVKPVESDSIGDIVDGFSITGSSQSPINNGNNISLVFIENSYIVFWILKDMFWAFGTDDFTFIGTNEVICSESIAICFGAIAIAIYVFISYLYRRNSLVLMDCLSTILWIMANFVWMCGEFFLRYQNLRFDDGDEGNDSATRIAACVLFLGGILIQLFVVLELTRCYRNSLLVFRRCCNFSRGDHSSDDLSSSSSTSSSPGNKKDQKIIEMLRIQNPIKYKHVMVTFSPHHERKLDDDEEESTMMEKNNDDNTVINDDQNVEVKLENSTLETASQPTISKNQLKRLRRDEYLKSKKKQKKEFEKLKKHAGKLSKGDISPTENEAKIPVITKTEDQIVNRQQKREDEISEFLERCNKNFSVIIDCSWESNHSESALRSLSQQIMFCYSCNKRSSKPCNIILSGVGPLLKAKFEKLHYDNWIGITTFFTDVLTDSCDPSINPLLPPKNKIVYLTSDSDEIIERLDPSDCYVIGGIVDRNSLKGATYKKAKELGIRTAKLPIKEHFELSATHILTVNHVFEILVNYGKCDSWPEAMESVLPKRKAPKIIK